MLEHMKSLWILFLEPSNLQELIEPHRDLINLFQVTYLISDKFKMRVQLHITLTFGMTGELILGRPFISKMPISEISLGSKLLEGRTVPYLREQRQSHKICS